MNTSAPPEKAVPPITPPPLEPEKIPDVIRDRKAADATKRVDTTAGDEGIDDKVEDDSETGAAISDEDLEDHEEDLGEE
ncbi:hypothetical protein [Prosthecobacter sp.]|uniref:hypothetical protein n=1 Tax=Prosthecobacter sp. TaxID=1965333 RepID=UPI0037830C58